MLPYFLKMGDENSVLFDLDDSYLEFYIPSMYFDRSFAVNNNGAIKILGLFEYYLVDKKTKKKSKAYTFEYPTVFDTIPSSTRKEKDDDMTYLVLTYEKGDKVMVSNRVSEDIMNVETFYRMFNTGKFPNSVPYDRIHEIFVDSMKYNGNSYGLNLQLFGLIIGAQAVSRTDINTPFRLSKSTDMHDYKINTVRLAPKLVSAYSSYTSEVYDEAIINASIVKNKASSPMEKLFMGY